jgi:hypothetical protein
MITNSPCTGSGLPIGAASLLSSDVGMTEDIAKAELAKLDPTVFSAGDDESALKRTKIMTDFAIFSLLHYIATQQPGWQAKFIVMDASHITSKIVLPTPSFSRRNCSDIEEQDVRNQLRQASNTFAEAKLNYGVPRCFPPGSTLQIIQDALTIRNAFVSVRFTAQFRGGADVKLFVFDITTSYSKLRSQHQSMPDYRHWIDRLINDARSWFGVAE